MEDYKLIIAGSRGWTDRELMEKNLTAFWTKFIHTSRKIIIISGTAKGADMMGELIAYERGFRVHRMPADWNTHGRSAGYIRNKEMAKIANGCLVCWDGLSKGSLHMWNLACEMNLDAVLLHREQPPPIVKFTVMPGKNYPGKV